jgi:soluble lytic murein transglycosylase-like protein
LKHTNKSRSIQYTIGFAVIFAFSFICAFCLTGLVAVDGSADDGSGLDRRQLLKNYRCLNHFLSIPADRSLADIDPADRDHPLLAAVAKMDLAQRLLAQKDFRAGGELLADIPDSFPHLASRRDELQFQVLYAAGRYRDFIAAHDRRPAAGRENRIRLVDCLLRTGQHERARFEFARLFSTASLETFTRVLARPALQRLLAGQDEESWTGKFSYLLKNRARSEFKRESPYCRYPSLVRLFKAEFAYQGREYAQAQAMLRGAFADKYKKQAERILLKIAVRGDSQPGSGGRLAAADMDPKLALELAEILASQGAHESALPFYAAAIERWPEPDEEYWKTVWVLAWTHYRLGRKEQALDYFRKGGESPILSYRIASRYWQGKLEEGQAPPLHEYPFSYYAVKTMPHRDLYRDLSREFLATIDKPTSPLFEDILGSVSVLAKYGLWQDGIEALRAARSDYRLTGTDRNMLAIIESLLYVRQNLFYQAYARFRSNFKQVESVMLPNFLSGIFFPRQYLPLIETYSREQQVDPYLVQALIREETFFQADAVSPAKAHGLMQLLLGTARPLARALGFKIKTGDLHDPEINIRLGLRYFKSLLDRYEGKLYLALAAYNAGPHRVDRWLEDFSHADEEEFIELIPFSETRAYVKNILRNYFFYRYYYADRNA